MKKFLHLFKWDMDDPNTLIGGWMGFSHTAMMAGVLFIIYLLTGSAVYTGVAGIAAMYYFVERETLGFKVWGWRSLDSFLDWFMPLALLVAFGIWSWLRVRYG